MKKTSLMALTASALLVLAGCGQSTPSASTSSTAPTASPSPYATGSPAPAPSVGYISGQSNSETVTAALASLSEGAVYDPSFSLSEADLTRPEWEGFVPVGSVQFTGQKTYTVPSPNISFPNGQGHVERSVRVLITCTGSEFRLSYGGRGYSSAPCGAQRPAGYVMPVTFQGNRVWFSVPSGEHGWARIYVKDVAVVE
jgi:hypothetical protein